MPITGTPKAKYYFLVLLGALLVAAGGLVMAPQAQSQTPPRECSPQARVCLEKTATPTTVTVGEQIAFTVRLINPHPEDRIGLTGPLEDVLPPEVRIDSVSQSVTPGGSAPPCSASGNTVTCPANPTSPIELPGGGEFTLTIVATPTECGDFVNTAVFNRGSLSEINVEAPFTVVGCEGAAPGQQQPGGGQPGGGGGAPITQEFEQETGETGEVDLAVDVS